MTIVLSIAAALVYGAADFFGGLASRRTATLAVVVWSQAAGLVLLVAVIGFLPAHATMNDVLWGAVCGIAGAGAVALLYRGLAVGVMGVVSPITAVLAAVIPVIFALGRGERPTILALIGICAALVAVVCVSIAPQSTDAPLARTVEKTRFPPGIPEALGAGIAFGFFFIALAQTHSEAGLVPLLSARVASLAILFFGGLLLRVSSLRVSRAGLPVIVLAGVLDMAANVLYVIAAHSGLLSIVAVLTSLYPAATVALAAIMLGERLGRTQWLGVGVALAGVLAISSRA